MKKQYVSPILQWRYRQTNDVCCASIEQQGVALGALGSFDDWGCEDDFS